jgi:hypothetical protein
MELRPSSLRIHAIRYNEPAGENNERGKYTKRKEGSVEVK